MKKISAHFLITNTGMDQFPKKIFVPRRDALQTHNAIGLGKKRE